MPAKRLLRVGLTGGIGSGKSTVGRLLAERGVVVIDADQLAREVVEPGTPGLAAIAARFGPGVVAADGRLDRPVLGRIVFADAAARADLNAIVHPLVRARAAELEAAAPDGSVVVQMIPLLVETGQQHSFDAVVVVDLPESLQIERVTARDGLDADAVRARMAAQASRQQRLDAATHVIDNSGQPEQLAAEVQQLWDALRFDQPDRHPGAGII